MEVYWLSGSALVALTLVCVKCLLSQSPPARVLDVYTFPGRWHYFKFGIVVTLLSIRKFFAMFAFQKHSRPGYGIPSHSSPIEMDRKQPLSEDSKAFDAVYMNGANRTGWYIIAGLARRPLNVDGFLILKVPGVGVLLSPKMPDTVLCRSEGDAEDTSYSSEGLTFTPLQPMKAWRLQYRGKMRLSHNKHTKVRVILDATWKSSVGFFNYDTDMLITNVAKAMSKETWTHNYFRCLKENHQTHYEQFGELSGKIVIDDVDFNMSVSAMRDHSFGLRREWKSLHRYVLHIFTLADGSRGKAGIVCLPNVFSRLEIGYMYGKDGSLDAVSNVDFDLYQHGENGIPPTDYGFTFMAGKNYYEVKVHVEETVEVLLGLEREARVVESISRFSVNGVQGWGVVEWMYSHPLAV